MGGLCLQFVDGRQDCKRFVSPVRRRQAAPWEGCVDSASTAGGAIRVCGVDGRRHYKGLWRRRQAVMYIDYQIWGLYFQSIDGRQNSKELACPVRRRQAIL